MNTIFKRRSGDWNPDKWLCLVLGMTLLIASSPLPTWAQNGLVVKVYSCPTGQAATMADGLRNEYGVIQGVRIAADQRTSRIVVQAPPDVQARISQRMAGTIQGPVPPVGQPAYENQASAKSIQSRTLALRRSKADQVESSLWSMLGNRLSSLPQQRQQIRRYQLALAGGGNVNLSIDFSAGQVTVEGGAGAVDAAARLIQVLDNPQDANGREVRVMPLRTAQLASVQRAATVIQNATGPQPADPPMVTMLFQQRDASGGTAGAGAAAKPQAAEKPAAAANTESASRGGLVNPVQIEMLEGLDVLVLRGSATDVEQVMEIINQVERLSAEITPAIEILPLKHLDCEAMAALVHALYDEVYLARQGNVSITPIVTPNAILIVGRPENVKTVVELVDRLDQPAVPGTQFQVFHLRYASAASAQVTIQNFFVERGGLSPIVRVTADARSNAVIVQASPRDMAEVAELIRKIDTATSDSVNEVRIIRLEHTLATDVASIMQSAIGAATGVGQQPGQQQGAAQQPFGQQQQNPLGTQGPGGTRQNEQRAAMLRFLTIDAKGRKLLNSGILSDVRITADVRANALVISSPPENLELLEALVHQLDSLPAAESQLKVFTIVNGDATNLAGMLQALFTGQATQQGGQGGFGAMLPAIQTSASGSETSLVPLRFGVDSRTNSIIASGTMADLNVVEAILTRLDDGEVRHRKSVVIRLKNSPATEVAQTINQFLLTQRQFEQSTPGLTSVYEQVEREVVVVPETVTNSLVLSATPKFFEEVKAIIEQLDARPPMVMIQVLIASIVLGDTNEFGIELGLQDSILFDRSILSNPVTTSTTLPNGTTTSTVIAANNAPGFNFNTGDPLGNSGLGTNLTPQAVAGQSIANFAVGRQNSTLGYGGLVLSAQSENVSALLRALAENHRVEILQRPQIMTLDNQPAFIQVGKRVPRITSVNTALTGTTNSIQLDNVGLILGVTPRISPDGLVVMQIDAEKSDLEPDATGIPVFTSPAGQIIRSPIIDATTAQTTVSALGDQTVVLGGLITKNKNESHRKVPWLGDLPVLGNLFRYDSTTNERTELLIIMTPHIIKNAADAEAIKHAEAARMSWCLCDVTKIYGEAGLRGRCDEWANSEVKVVYPDQQPTATGTTHGAGVPGQISVPEPVATPQGVPSTPSVPSMPPSGQPSIGPKPSVPSAPILEPVPDDPSAQMRYPVMQQQVGGVQPAVYPAQPGPQPPANPAQPAYYQQPAVGAPAYGSPPQGYFYR